MQYIVFKSPACLPCARLEPRVAEVAEGKPEDVFMSVDVTTDPEVAAQWGVMAVPTMVLLDSAGKEIARGLGPEAFTVL